MVFFYERTIWKYSVKGKTEPNIPIDGISEYQVPNFFVFLNTQTHVARDGKVNPPLFDRNDFIIQAPVVDETDERRFDQ